MRGTDVAQMKKRYRTAVEERFDEVVEPLLSKVSDLRYGENPNQSAAIYRKFADCPEVEIKSTKTGKGGLSATNFMDITRAMNILKFFEAPSVAVMKHLIPSGFATQGKSDSLEQIYLAARDADARSAFGSVVVSNIPIDKATADAINSTYVEVVAAPGYDEGVMEIFEKKKNLRVAKIRGLYKIPRYTSDSFDDESFYDVQVLPGGYAIVQQLYLSSIKGIEYLITDPMITKKKSGKSVVVERDPTTQEIFDLLTSWYVNIGVRSNGIVIVKDGVTLAIGSGQQERVGAVEQAIVKAYQKAMDREGISYDPLMGIAEKDKLNGNPLQGAVASSDAFFPFRDSVDTLARVGISAVVQPGGSVKDFEVIKAANEHKMAMAYTLERCFAHF